MFRLVTKLCLMTVQLRECLELPGACSECFRHQSHYLLSCGFLIALLSFAHRDPITQDAIDALEAMGKIIEASRSLELSDKTRVVENYFFHDANIAGVENHPKLLCNESSAHSAHS